MYTHLHMDILWYIYRVMYIFILFFLVKFHVILKNVYMIVIMLCGEIQNSANSVVITFIGRFVLNLKPSCYRVIYRARFPS